MKSLGIKDKWSGHFSEILNYLKDNYPNIMFERAIYGESLILNVPEEYDIYDLNRVLDEMFHYDYNIALLDVIYENRLLLINKL